MAETDAQDWLTAKEVAALIRVSPSWVYRQCREQRGTAPPHTWFGGLLRIPRTEFYVWLKGRAQ